MFSLIAKKTAVRVFIIGLLMIFFVCQNAQAAISADQFVKEKSDKVLAKVLANKDGLKSDKKRLYSLIEKDVLPNFDFVRMSRSVLGKHWRGSSKTEQKAFVKEFSRLLVKTYGTALLSYSGQEIVYKPAVIKNKGKTASVQTKVPSSGAEPVDVGYLLFSTGDSWKVIDIKIGGVSLVANYRTNFASEISKSSVASLIKQLQAKNAR